MFDTDFDGFITVADVRALFSKASIESMGLVTVRVGGLLGVVWARTHARTHASAASAWVRVEEARGFVGLRAQPVAAQQPVGSSAPSRLATCVSARWLAPCVTARPPPPPPPAPGRARAARQRGGAGGHDRGRRHRRRRAGVAGGLQARGGAVPIGSTRRCCVGGGRAPPPTDYSLAMPVHVRGRCLCVCASVRH